MSCMTACALGTRQCMWMPQYAMPHGWVATTRPLLIMTLCKLYYTDHAGHASVQLVLLNAGYSFSIMRWCVADNFRIRSRVNSTSEVRLPYQINAKLVIRSLQADGLRNVDVRQYIKNHNYVVKPGWPCTCTSRTTLMHRSCTESEINKINNHRYDL